MPPGRPGGDAVEEVMTKMVFTWNYKHLHHYSINDLIMDSDQQSSGIYLMLDMLYINSFVPIICNIILYLFIAWDLCQCWLGILANGY